MKMQMNREVNCDIHIAAVDKPALDLKEKKIVVEGSLLKVERSLLKDEVNSQIKY